MGGQGVRIGKLVNEILLPELSALGFSLKNPRQGIWEFRRSPTEGFEQHVFLYNDPHTRNQLHCDYGTTDVPFVSCAELIGKDLLSNSQYSDEDSLRAILKQLLLITLEHGIPAIEKRGGPFFKPTEADGRYLLDNHVELAASFADKHALSFDQPILGLETVEEIIIGSRGNADKPDRDLLIGAAAYLGELLGRLGGEWEWDGFRKTVRIHHRLGFPRPLSKVCELWSRGTPGVLIGEYKSFDK